MIKKLIFTLSIFGLSVAAMAQTAPEPPKAEIKFETTEHDFGKIREGTMAMYEFRFTNTGKVALVLSDVHPSCGCTTPEWPKEPIAPGATNKVKAVFNSYSRPGNFEKYITVKSNTSTPEITLKIKGTVEPVPVEPQSPVRNQGVD
ncbi:MAG: DUF1573 domain-containing protein [Bacteroidia bacterium]|jgi:hypothetical protein